MSGTGSSCFVDPGEPEGLRIRLQYKYSTKNTGFRRQRRQSVPPLTTGLLPAALRRTSSPTDDKIILDN
jgi:hypothetical protein